MSADRGSVWGAGSRFWARSSIWDLGLRLGPGARFRPGIRFNRFDVWEGLPGLGGGSWSPPCLSQPFMDRFSKFLCLVKAFENRHWFLLHKQLSIVHRLAARGRRSDEGQSRQYFQGKNQISQFLSYINVIYLKRTHFSCRIQIQTKK